MPLDPTVVRARFPALAGDTVYLDNPGGTQICQPAMDRLNRCMVDCNANAGGAFPMSRASDEAIHSAREAMADFVNAERPEEIVFGQNMTSLTFSMSRAIGKTLKKGDRIVVTRLDHDANITPWVLMAEDRGCVIDWVDFLPEDGTLDMTSLAQALDKGPKVFALGYASNALGTINGVLELTHLAHEAGALVYIDAVQYAAHGPVDVRALECDYLVCSAYKFFGPHVGVLYGKYDLLDGLPAYKVRPAPDDPPGKFETGTGNHEGIAGVHGAIDYFQWIGQTFGQEHREAGLGRFTARRADLKAAMSAIHGYERELSRVLLNGLADIPGVRVYGLRTPDAVDDRTPTVSFTVEGRGAREVCEVLGNQRINLWDGHYYAVETIKRLGVEGMVRAGAVHYNTVDEVEKFLAALRRLSAPG